MNRIARMFLLLALSLLTTALFAQEDFSADIVNHNQGKDAAPGKMYVTKDKLRFEGQDKGGHGGGAVIINMATQTSDVVMAERKMYLEFPQGQGPGAQRTWSFFRARDIDNACSDWQKLATNHGGTCKKIGSETVNGRSTVKYEATNQNGETSYIWLDPKIAFPIKWEGKNGGGELQNIKEGSQPSSLFEIPSDYQKMQMPAGMPNMQRPQ